MTIERTLAALLLAAVSSGCTAQAFCAKRYECAEDQPGDDFLRICEIDYDGRIRALRANEEADCHELADAQLRLDACRAQLDCDDFNEADLGQKCEDEVDDYNDAFRDADDECGSRD